jgi:hypothetical protein
MHVPWSLPHPWSLGALPHEPTFSPVGSVMNLMQANVTQSLSFLQREAGQPGAQLFQVPAAQQTSGRASQTLNSTYILEVLDFNIQC